MKMLVSFITLALSFSALATSIDTESFLYDGTQNSVELILKAEHTEYRLVSVPSTCYRDEVRGYTTVCSGGGYGPGYGYPAPRPYPGYPHHRPYPGGYYGGPVGGVRTCIQQPITRRVSYPCHQTVSVPSNVYDVEARVIVDVTNLSGAATPGERFNVTLTGDSLDFRAVGSNKFFIVKKHQDIQRNVNGNVKQIDAVYAVELVEAAPVLKAIKMTNIQMNDDVLNFDIGEVSARNNLEFSLKVERKKLLGSDTVLLDRKLSVDEATVTNTNAGAEVGVNVKALNVELTKGKYNMTATAKVKVDGSMMNEDAFKGQLEASRTLIYKVR